LPTARGKSKMNVHDEQSFRTDILNNAGIKNYQRYETIADIPEDDLEKILKRLSILEHQFVML
jgi:hypothetical protein